ncbi:MAG: PQQ-dependent sugar dehydrogenase [Planctomycetes bacterium]|nr:PQQ-dependent sugar dehydrogenase [Planctomycetota bacterium]
MRASTVLTCLVMLLPLPLAHAELPPGFQRTVLLGDLCKPTSLVATPDGRLFVGLVGGTIRVIDNGVPLPDPLVELDVVEDNEQGLVGMELGPDFATTGALYIYYTAPPDVRNRVSRFTVVGNSIDPASEFVVWENAPSITVGHQGGGLAFHTDGTLFIATGDQGSSGTAQMLDSQHGKILRVNPDGSIPADNPFVGLPGIDPAVWALGLRNPYRLFFDELEGDLWIGDIGSSGGPAWEEIDLGLAGGNYGWADSEGENCYVADCSAYIEAVHQYRHDDPLFATPTLNACVILGPVYRGGNFPAEYEGDLFYGDWSGEWLRRLEFDDVTGAVTADVLFDSAPDGGDVADIVQGPDGALYTVSVGVIWCFPPGLGTVEKIEWVGTPPDVVANVDDPSGSEPHAVQFSSAGTVDIDGEPLPLTYLWTFGDGGTSTDASPDHVYTEPGLFLATLTVSDGQYTVASDPIEVLVGDPPQLRRGDCNGDSGFDVADAVHLLSTLFGGGGSIDCADACDANDDGGIDISDPISMLDTLFGGAGPLSRPYPGCGPDPGLDGLGCVTPACP